MVKNFESPSGPLSLGRIEEDDHPSLQAWDAADELALGKIAELRRGGSGAAGGSAEPEGPVSFDEVLVVNDSFGALTLGLADLGPATMTDSFTSARAIGLNRERNGCRPERLDLFCPGETSRSGFTFCVIKVPKTLSLLDYELGLLEGLLAPGAFVLGAGMTKDIHRSTLELFEKRFGLVRTSLAAKKARLIFSRFRDRTAPGDERAVSAPEYPKIVEDRETGLKFVQHAGVFSQGGIDAGTRALLSRLGGGSPDRVVDLGCGAGVLGIAAALRWPRCQVSLADESFLAVESARLGFRLNGIEERGTFVWGNRLDSFPPLSADLVLCNPPFHARREISLSPALGMFRDAARVLARGGEFLVVANSHLGYLGVLRSLFSRVVHERIGEKYIVYSCGKG